MNTIKIESITGELLFTGESPSTWNELTRKQLILVAGMYNKGISVIDFKVKAIFSFLNVKRKILFKIHDEDAYYLAETFNFLVDDCTLTKNVIRRIGKYYGPDDSMKNVTFGEFVSVQLALEAYNQHKDIKYLDEMISVIYRRRKFGWIIRRFFYETTDCRLKLLDRTCPKRAKAISRIDPAVKFAVFLFVTGVCNSLPERFPNVYHKKGNKEEGNNGWIQLIITLAKGNTDDESLKKVYESNLYNVLYGLEHSAIEYAKYQKDHPDMFKDDEL